jgi:hypothetical protein
MDELKLTSVKILSSLYKRFKRFCLEDDFTLQKLVNRSLDLYTTDDDFKDKIDKYAELEESGSVL